MSDRTYAELEAENKRLHTEIKAQTIRHNFALKMVRNRMLEAIRTLHTNPNATPYEASVIAIVLRAIEETEETP